MADLGELPETAMMEILSRLPPESLVRFKCVSKSWYALINDPQFGGSLQNRNVLLKRAVRNNETRFSFLKYPLAADDHTSLEVEDAHFPSFVDEEAPYIDIHGHSHGLVCLSYGGNPNPIFLYNPATGELRKLPPSILLISYDDSIEQDLDSVANAVGFGYDPKSRDFKVVRVVDFVPSSVEFYDLEPPATVEVYNHYLPSRAEVYDLKKDEWREIETPVPGRAFGMPSFHMYYQGFYYWWGVSKEVGRAEIILSFDMSQELFGQIPVPESFEKEDGNDRSLGILNGSIVLFHYPDGGHEKSFDIWGMVKLGGVVSWSKLFTIGPVSDIRAPLAFVGPDQLLMETYVGQLILYNINTQHFKHLPLEGQTGVSQASVFVKTLLSVNGGH